MSTEQVTVRNINLQMEQDAHHLASLEFSGRVNRDQRDLTLSLNANVNASDYPHQLTADIQQLNWQLTGPIFPPRGSPGRERCRPCGAKNKNSWSWIISTCRQMTVA
jgi:AsmA protein